MPNPPPMRASAKCRAFIKGFEQCRLKAYKPTPQDRWTCGWGTTGPDVGPNTVWTQEHADARFNTDLVTFEAGVNRLIQGGAPTTQGQFDALVSFAYNCGLDIDEDAIAEGLGDSTLLRKHRAGDYAGAAAEFAKWNKQAGRVLNGLTRRRAAEAALYRGQG